MKIRYAEIGVVLATALAHVTAEMEKDKNAVIEGKSLSLIVVDCAEQAATNGEVPTIMSLMLLKACKSINEAMDKSRQEEGGKG